MGRLTPAQHDLLDALTLGDGIVYSQDGDYGWLTVSRRDLDEFGISVRELQDLRDRRLIGHEPGDHEWVRFAPPEVITPAGRAALKEQTP